MDTPSSKFFMSYSREDASLPKKVVAGLRSDFNGGLNELANALREHLGATA